MLLGEKGENMEANTIGIINITATRTMAVADLITVVDFMVVATVASACENY